MFIKEIYSITDYKQQPNKDLYVRVYQRLNELAKEIKFYYGTHYVYAAFKDRNKVEGKNGPGHEKEETKSLSSKEDAEEI